MRLSRRLLRVPFEYIQHIQANTNAASHFAPKFSDVALKLNGSKWSNGGSSLGNQSLIPLQREEDVGKPTLVLDLDETLVDTRSGMLHRRPFLDHFLKWVTGRFEVILWTSAQEQYAGKVLRFIDRHGTFSSAIFRDGRWFPTLDNPEEGRLCAKRLELLGRDLSTTILIENSPECCVNDVHNALLLPDFECNSLSELAKSTDTALKELVPLLERFLKSSLPVSAFLYQLSQEQAIIFAERSSPLFGPLGHFYHIGPPPQASLPSSHSMQEAAWPTRV
eukprot:GGOE01002567.1.p1 GENE.GGOE01002567.1~~GGOE01002567.1.p1  ORF type:complete len:278 (-),score=60.68 GGOE01002567.1:318-1151(-)